MALQIKTVKDTVKDMGINAILYSQSGFGKTYAIKTLPDLESVLIATSEEGLQTIVEECPDIDCVEINSIQDFRDLYGALSENSEQQQD